MPALSDESLLAGLASGDPDAAAAFVRCFQGRVYGLALTILRDAQTAEEVAQETFVRAWRHAATYDARRGRVTTWLLTIARNLAIDHIRLRAMPPVDPAIIAAEIELSRTDAGPSERAERDDLRAAIAALPDEQRRALVLAAYFGRTAREISEMDGVALGTVKTRIRSAMGKLRSALELQHDL